MDKIKHANDRVSIMIPRHMRDKLKLMALKEKMTVKAIVLGLIQGLLDEKIKRRK